MEHGSEELEEGGDERVSDVQVQAGERRVEAGDDILDHARVVDLKKRFESTNIAGKQVTHDSCG